MLKPLYTIIAYGMLLLTTPGFAQSKKTDSLISLLTTAKDTTRINLLNQLSKSQWYNDPLKTIEYAAQAMDLALQLKFDKGLTTAYNNTGVGYYQQNKYDQAIQWYTKAMELNHKLDDYTGEAYALSNIGMVYWKQGNLPTAVQFYLRALKIWEDNHNEKEATSIFDNLGNVYNDQEDYDRALTYYFKALELEKKHDKPGYEVSMTLSNIGTAYLSQSNPREALKYFLESLKPLANDNVENRAVSLSNIGLTYIELNDPEKAFPYLSDALKLQKEMGDQDGTVPTLIGMAQGHLLKKNYTESNQYARQALEIAQKIDDKGSLAEIWLTLSDISQQQGDFKTAYKQYESYVIARDSERLNENVFKIAHLQAGYETEKKQAEIELLKKEQEQQAFRRNTIGAGLIALLIIAGLIVSRQRLKIRQNNQLININSQLTKQSEKLEEQTKKLRELDQVKSTFFANISHEFRTPLTLILNSLLDKIDTIKTSGNTAELGQLEVMHRNAKRMLNLINQLLDLSKLDAGQMVLTSENCNLTQLLKAIHGSFSSLTHSKQIAFNLLIPDEEILTKLDTDKVEKILYNLLSNAFKFTPLGGAISLKAELIKDDPEKTLIQIAVKDSGRGMASEQLEFVFNRFYQGKQYYSDEQGSGIGLALTKELVELHGGKIWVESEHGEGSSFIFRIPLVPVIRDEEFSEKVIIKITGVEALSNNNSFSEKSSDDQELPTVLVVEDNDDLRNYISQHLRDKYLVLETENGRRGLEKAVATIPDLVISDWMMPEMDGITLCNHLKNDERTSHIPVILLTALASDDAKLKGLESGADEYLTKPFDKRELLVRIKNLIESRRQLRERFSRELHLGPKNIQVSSMDEKFLDKVMQAVETHMGDPDFSMEKFGQQVSLSRMQLHRKLKALTGESPGDFLRTMRLKRARRLLESRSGNVSEIAYEVGFNNLSYFSKCYREQFGISPIETISSNVTDVSGNVTPSGDIKG